MIGRWTKRNLEKIYYVAKMHASKECQKTVKTKRINKEYGIGIY